MNNFLSLIIVIAFICDSIIYNWKNKQFLKKYSSDISLYNTIYPHIISQSYSLLEPSIKLTFGQGLSINHQRYTIPILFGNVGSEGIDMILSDFIDSKSDLETAISFVKKNISSLQDDVILGVDNESNIKKIYIDKSGCLICLELPSGNFKQYLKIPKMSVIHKIQKFKAYSSIKSDPSQWKYILTKQDNKISRKVTGYHIYLKKYTKIKDIYNLDTSIIPSKFLNDYVYWISISNNEVTFYTRLPNSYIYRIKEIFTSITH
jgi:hypothetical protein